jgi:tetratricopeptide (TPR) repeat protein
LEDAVAVAAAENLAAVVAAAMRRVGGADVLSLTVFSPAGDTLYSVAAQVTPEANSLETLAGLARTVRRRLGEPRGEIEGSSLAKQVLSTSPDAMRLYAEAERHFNQGRYSQAVAAAVEAVDRDSTFAMAYRTLAESYAMLGQRTRARTALEAAWNNSGRLNRREQLRLLGDRHTWEGRYAEAVFTYDELFKQHRDDVGALKSQAIVQRMIGARGMGIGNLKVAYSIDRYDWPPLSRIARYLDYRGRLPDVDSLVASLDGSP